MQVIAKKMQVIGQQNLYHRSKMHVIGQNMKIMDKEMQVSDIKSNVIILLWLYNLWTKMENIFNRFIGEKYGYH